MVVVTTEDGPDVQMAKNADVDCVILKYSGDVDQIISKAE
jgi:hypothetical protein